MAALRTRLSSKGQVIIPRRVRDRIGWAAGTELIVEECAESVTLRRAKPFPSRRPEEVRGCLKRLYAGPAIAVEDMDRGIPLAVGEDWE